MSSNNQGLTRSPFTDEELQEWRRVLVDKGVEITGSIADLRQEAVDLETASNTTVPTHLADRASEAEYAAQDLALAGDEAELLWQVRRALDKIKTNHPLPFGLCEYSGEPIEIERLELMPWTPLSLAGVTAMQERGLEVQDMLIDD